MYVCMCVFDMGVLTIYYTINSTLKQVINTFPASILSKRRLDQPDTQWSIPGIHIVHISRVREVDLGLVCTQRESLSQGRPNPE